MLTGNRMVAVGELFEVIMSFYLKQFICPKGTHNVPYFITHSKVQEADHGFEVAISTCNNVGPPKAYRVPYLPAHSEFQFQKSPCSLFCIFLFWVSEEKFTIFKNYFWYQGRTGFMKSHLKVFSFSFIRKSNNFLKLFLCSFQSTY